MKIKKKYNSGEVGIGGGGGSGQGGCERRIEVFVRMRKSHLNKWNTLFFSLNAAKYQFI